MFDVHSRQRVNPLAERRLAAQLRHALAVLPASWTVLVSRWPSAADGPPWVRFLALHRDKGIGLVDTVPCEAAVAPLEDFLENTGFGALQTSALPVAPIVVGADEMAIVIDLLEAAFARSRLNVANPAWCEAVVELLLSTPGLMLVRLRRRNGPTRSMEAAPELPLPPPPSWQPMTPIHLPEAPPARDAKAAFSTPLAPAAAAPRATRITPTWAGRTPSALSPHAAAARRRQNFVRLAVSTFPMVAFGIAVLWYIHGMSPQFAATSPRTPIKIKAVVAAPQPNPAAELTRTIGEPEPASTTLTPLITGARTTSSALVPASKGAASANVAPSPNATADVTPATIMPEILAVPPLSPSLTSTKQMHHAAGQTFEDPTVAAAPLPLPSPKHAAIMPQARSVMATATTPTMIEPQQPHTHLVGPCANRSRRCRDLAEGRGR